MCGAAECVAASTDRRDRLCRPGGGRHRVPSEAIGDALADAYNALHEEELSLFPDAHETLDRLKELGTTLALITNGAAEPQRTKVVRFALEHRFDHIQIEGEHGFGKPAERAYNHAIEVLGVGPDETLMVCDNVDGKSWHPNGSASTRSGMTVTAWGYPAAPQSGPTASSAACRNCCCSRLVGVPSGRRHCFGLWRAQCGLPATRALLVDLVMG
jgi:HAD superfamily hydrolase (TIGR01509 family)